MADPNVSFEIFDNAPNGAPLLTIPGEIGLYRRRVSASLQASEADGVTAIIRFEKCFVRLGGGDDAFLRQLLPGSPDTESFDVGLRWNTKNGFSFLGSGALEITLPVRARLPVITIDALHIILRPAPDGKAITIELSSDLTASLASAIQVSLHRIGVTTDLFLGAGPGGLPDMRAAFKPPSGAGLSLDFAVLKGGGFLQIDPDRGQYAGVFSANLFGIGITVIAIIQTKPSFSLLTVLSASFEPVGLDISFGFTINRVGGLVGLNRVADTEAVRLGIRSNAIASVLFPQNPVANAPRIITDLARFFPPLPGHILVGPMLELGWGKPTGMFTLAMGVILQVPDPSLMLLGVFRVLVPPGIDRPPLRIQVNFVGGVDFPRRLVFFDAALFDSRLITYTLEGEMAARLRWGAAATFAVTVGGFHPKYVAAADLDIPPLRRVTINLLPTDDNPRLRIESYYAATSNTLQHGARLEVYAAAAGFGLRGHLGYDVLVQLSPLHFVASFSGEVAIIAFDEDIMSLRLDLTLEGPSPWRVDGEVSFKIIFKRIRIPVRATFGSGGAPSVPDADVAQEFLDQLNAPYNWTSTLPAQSELLVHLSPRLETPENAVLAHPSATVKFEQRSIPLKVEIQRFGAAKPKAERFFDTEAMQVRVQGGGAPKPIEVDPVEGEFAPAQYFELSLDQKLSAASFDKRKCGIESRASALVAFGATVPRLFTHEIDYRDPDAQMPMPGVLGRFRESLDLETALATLGGSALGRAAILRERVDAQTPPDAIRVSPGGFRIVDAATMTPVEGLAGAATRVDADSLLQTTVTSRPALTGRLTVVSELEMV